MFLFALYFNIRSLYVDAARNRRVLDDRKDGVGQVMQELYAFNRIYDIEFDADLLSHITTQVGAEWIAECTAAATARPIKAADMSTRIYANPVTLAHRADHLHRDSASSS